MKIGHEKRHIETEKKIYQIMDKRKTFLLTLAIVGLGSFFLYIRHWSIKKPMDSLIWTSIVGIIFVVQTIMGYNLFECERKKYIDKHCL